MKVQPLSRSLPLAVLYRGSARGSVPMSHRFNGSPCSSMTYAIAFARSFSVQRYFLLPRCAQGLCSLIQHLFSLIVLVALAFIALSTASGLRFALITQ